jgi:glutamate carboxypeptidase
MAELLDRLVRAESPSLVPGSERGALDLLGSELESAGFVTRRLRGDGTGDHLLARAGVRRRHAGYQLISGHVDTVWPLGSIQAMPPHRDNGHYFGPGAYDMKGGLVQLIFALRALHELRLSPRLTPVVFVNSDEEIGSVDSSRHIRRLARGAARAFVLEPPASPGGALKTGRKGVSRFEILVTGRAAHAGTSPEEGVSAILELSHLVQRLFALSHLWAGVTVNVGTIDGGLAANVIAPEASALVDVRAPTEATAARVAQAIRSLTPSRPGTTLAVRSELGRPPMLPNRRNRVLFRRARRLAAELGLRLEESPLVGGASDANFTSELTATLDGLGAVGDGAHSRDEHVVVSALPQRAALLALLLLEA